MFHKEMNIAREDLGERKIIRKVSAPSFSGMSLWTSRIEIGPHLVILYA